MALYNYIRLWLSKKSGNLSDYVKVWKSLAILPNAIESLDQRTCAYLSLQLVK